MHITEWFKARKPGEKFALSVSATWLALAILVAGASSSNKLWNGFVAIIGFGFNSTITILLYENLLGSKNNNSGTSAVTEPTSTTRGGTAGSDDEEETVS
ncbi:MAG: hypothetical protein GC193_05340 [Cryomorphaceae bacterium]|nr:hypothetical protein [Cryomorphaceae bacterium]